MSASRRLLYERGVSTSNDIYLGVDGGNSQTRAMIVDASAAVLGYGTGGNANHQQNGFDTALDNVSAAVRTACDSAGVTLDRITGAFFALAGDDLEDDHTTLVAAVSSLWPRLRFGLANDVWAGLRAGAVGGWGVAVNCGSGTGAVGRSERGEEMMIPDLGYAFGDSGGGRQIAVDALRAVSRAADGRGSATTLTPRLLALMGQASVEELRLAQHHDQITREMYGQMTRLVFEAAADGDEVAAAILRRIGEELGLSCVAIARRLNMQHSSFTLVLTGGTIRSLHSPLATAAIARVHRDAPYCEPTLPRVMPVAGAALLALDAANRAVTPDHYAHLQAQGYAWHPEESFG